MIEITVKDIIEIHDRIIDRFGGSQGHLNIDALNSIDLIYQTIFDISLYPTIEAKAARLCYTIVKSHAFVDGNKRTGFLSMVLLLERNGFKYSYHDTDSQIIDDLASSKLTYEQLVTYIKTKIK